MSCFPAKIVMVKLFSRVSLKRMRYMRWRGVLSMFVGMIMLPYASANSCKTDADCRHCGGYCENPSFACMCPPSYCNSTRLSGSCSFNGRDYRCQCQSGEFCGYWSPGSGCISAMVRLASTPPRTTRSTTSSPAPSMLVILT